MGEVFRAYDERLQRHVALKQIRREAAAEPNARRRFEREARAAARLRHPGIVELHDLFGDDQGDWIVMEMVEGRSLTAAIREEDLQPNFVLEIAIHLAQALASAHGEGIVHRDLKPSNVMLTPEGRPKILDFGLAKPLREQGDSATASITAEGHIVGTPLAMSPEQATGGRIDQRSDLFSFGSLLYELATGVSPFAADSAVAILHRICAHRPAPILEQTGGYPEAFTELVSRLLEKDPNQRPKNAAQVASQLERIAGRLARGETTGNQHPTTPGPGAERRQLTVLECLLVTGASGTHDGASVEPSVVLAGFETLARQVVEGLEGHVARHEGHRLEVYFGFPRAQEDAARRAIHAARELGARLASSPSLGPFDPSLRIGVHTGPAIVHPDGDQRPVLGSTADIATSLARVADSGEILISETVRRLVTDSYPVEDSGQTLGETEVFRIGLGEGPGGERFAAAPLLARRTEIGLLADCAARAVEGAGQVAFVQGEAGIGKSRLLAGLKVALEPMAMDWLLAQASPIHHASPLHPVITLIESLLDAADPKGPSPKSSMDGVRILEAWVEERARPCTIPLLASLLGLPIDTPYYLPDVTPQKQRELTLQALVDLMTGFAAQKPLVLVVEDLHWIDPTTLDWLGLLIDTVKRSRLFLVFTFRPEFELPWPAAEHVTRLDLGRLTGVDIDRLIDHLTGGRSIPEAVRQQIVAKTDGVPLFVEELTKSLLESGALMEREGAYELDGAVDNLAVPATLQDSLMSRLDRLGLAKSVAQLAATIGREFSQPLLAAASNLEETQLSSEIDRLVEAELVFPKGFSIRKRFVINDALCPGTKPSPLVGGLDPSDVEVHAEENSREVRYLLEELIENLPQVSERTFGDRHQVGTPRSSLKSSLDRLPSAKELAQVFKTLGIEVSVDASKRRGHRDGEQRRVEVGPLVDAGVLVETQERAPTYIFGHALIQETAYHSLLVRTRRGYHARIARLIEDRFQDISETRPEVVAHHFTEADLAESAIPFWYRAGRRSVERSANLEAIAQLKKGLGLLTKTPETPHRWQQELDLVVALGVPELATAGYSAPEVGATFRRAKELCGQIGETLQQYEATLGLCNFHLVRGDLQVSLELSNEVIELGLDLEDLDRVFQGRTQRGVSLYLLGNLNQGMEDFQAGFADYEGAMERDTWRRTTQVCGLVPWVCRTCHIAVLEWLFGQPEGALETCRSAVRHAELTAHPFSQAWALFYAAVVHGLRREFDHTAEMATALVAVCQQHGFSYRLAQARILQSWAEALEGGTSQSLETSRGAIASIRRIGVQAYVPLFLAFQADAALALGEIEFGLETIEDGLGTVDATGESFFVAELLRLEGELLLARSTDLAEAAEQRFRQAVETAQRQNAPALALRAADSLSRLEQGQGCGDR